MMRAIEKCHFENENIIKSMYVYERGDDDLKSRVYFQMASRQFIYENWNFTLKDFFEKKFRHGS